MRGHVSSLVNCSYIYLNVKNKGGLCLVWREEGEVEVYVLLEKAEPPMLFLRHGRLRKRGEVKLLSFSSANACFSFFFP